MKSHKRQGHANIGGPGKYDGNAFLYAFLSAPAHRPTKQDVNKMVIDFFIYMIWWAGGPEHSKMHIKKHFRRISPAHQYLRGPQSNMLGLGFRILSLIL